jgi:hypothetical protein
MAIVQISKIIHRTGANADLPQLDVGEIGFASDDQRLYIGNDPILHPVVEPALTTQTEILTEVSTLNFARFDGSANMSMGLSDVGTGQIIVADGGDINANIFVNYTGNMLGPNSDVKLNLGPAANLNIQGGSNGAVLSTDGSGNVTWTNHPSVSNVQLTYNSGASHWTIFANASGLFAIDNSGVTRPITLGSPV